MVNPQTAGGSRQSATDRWTQFEKTYFSAPGKWSSPQGTPRWQRIVALAGSGKEVDAQPGAKVKVVAAELEFPGAKWNLAFKFETAQEVTFTVMARS